MDAKISGHFCLEEGDNFMGGDPSVEINVQHALDDPPHGRRHHYPRVVVPAEHLVQMGIDTPLLGDDFGEEPALDRKQPLLLQMPALLARHQQRQTHPQGHPNHDLQQDAAETPHVHRPGVTVVVHHLLVELLLVHSFVLVDDVVEDLGRHVFGRGHGELSDVPELKGRTVVDELHIPEDAVGPLPLHLQQDVLGLEVRVNHLTLAQQRQGSANLQYQGGKELGLGCHRLI